MKNINFISININICFMLECHYYEELLDNLKTHFTKALNTFFDFFFHFLKHIHNPIITFRSTH